MKAPTQGQDRYMSLRQKVFTVVPAALKIADGPTKSSVWALVMEMGFSAVKVTVVALKDGNASIYLDNGGGVVGGFSHPTVRRAAIDAIAQAQNFVDRFAPATSYPLPDVDHVNFYLRVGEEAMVADVELAALENGHTLTPLYIAGQEVVTQLRKISS